MSHILRNASAAFRNQTNVRLMYNAVLFKLCSMQPVVQFMSSNMNHPLFGPALKAVVQNTAFNHFCAGETLDSFKEVSRGLFALDHVTTILDHSVEEVDSAEAWSANLQKKMELLSLGAGYQSVKFIPIKCTSLVSSNMLEALTNELRDRMATGAGADHSDRRNADDIQYFDDAAIAALPIQDRDAWWESLDKMDTLCAHAASCKVALLLDAEQSYRQPAIEVLARKLTAKHNLPGQAPVLYNTYQMYLRRSQGALMRDLNWAGSCGHVFAAKIVRGAYMTSERQRAAKHGQTDPVLPSKEAVDESYNSAIREVLNRIASQQQSQSRPVVMLATHNRQSIAAALDEMQRLGIATNTSNVHFAQILGMCDHITTLLGHHGYNASKLISFGEFEQVMPWLLRRFQENQDIFGAMQQERRLFGEEIMRRLFH